MASRVTISAAHLYGHRQEGDESQQRILASDESWEHSWGPELKRQSAVGVMKALDSRELLRTLRIRRTCHPATLSSFRG